MTRKNIKELLFKCNNLKILRSKHSIKNVKIIWIKKNNNNIRANFLKYSGYHVSIKIDKISFNNKNNSSILLIDDSHDKTSVKTIIQSKYNY